MFEMLSQIPTGSLVIMTLLAIVSIVFCILQIRMRKKQNLRVFCQISTVLPLLYSLLITFRGFIMMFENIKRANDISPEIMVCGLLESLIVIMVGLIITIFLFIVYAITAAICGNLKN